MTTQRALLHIDKQKALLWRTESLQIKDKKQIGADAQQRKSSAMLQLVWCAYLQTQKLMSLRTNHSEAVAHVCLRSCQSENVCQRRTLSEVVCLRMSLSEHVGLVCVCLSSSLQARLPPCSRQKSH